MATRGDRQGCRRSHLVRGRSATSRHRQTQVRRGPAAGYFGARFIKVVNFEERNDLRVVVPAEIEIAMPLAEQLDLVTVPGGQLNGARLLERQLQAKGPGKEPDRTRVLFGRYAQPD